MANYFVRKTGSDANAGTTKGAAKLTIQAAINIATSPGDNVYVGAGVYREIVTFGTSGTAGNVISLIGDYKGTFTDDAGVVRITGSNDDITATRANCITAAGKSFLSVFGFVCDMSTSHPIKFANSGANDFSDITITECHVHGVGSFVYGMLFDQAAASKKFSNITISSCVVFGGQSSGVQIQLATETNGLNILVSNCMFIGTGGVGLRVYRVGGLTVQNCTFISTILVAFLMDGNTGTALANCYNCIFYSCIGGMQSNVAATITEDHNTFYGCQTNRTNVAAGANSVTRPPLFDTRWFFEAVNGGRLVTPFDLASYSTLVEYNSGTGAPATDLRGAPVVGTYREWGALEHSANYQIGGRVSIDPIGGRL